jgi:hypothetical protein
MFISGADGKPVLDTSPRIMQVICLFEKRGTGLDDDPVRLVRRIYSTDGLLLAEHDSYAHEELRSWLGDLPTLPADAPNPLMVDVRKIKLLLGIH